MVLYPPQTLSTIPHKIGSEEVRDLFILAAVNRACLQFSSMPDPMYKVFACYGCFDPFEQCDECLECR